ncbi:hypothetical protein A1Q1_00207 [Trichosporon asahii var. asahii CBS 2479]|uniref:Uncharacterized protein n=1 Tax=Trichosporon asahii var. asahii (strain ATCC 90039 / CBS 2479 / JCM 2466 / KCTC 7840 / NBRC 103889/ NCYC 2677 / UAMH 7654) TaxID=1186058 RepID=J5TE06_TRIAS|nr:hypothetical protein A1Q1_00207 [Trichosporon asahii var. asahii CBS 2479]EJT50466.1 hypothetical protein A1Q1_00207 [Trichosporon asahii var. asahii CBS 2479]
MYSPLDQLVKGAGVGVGGGAPSTISSSPSSAAPDSTDADKPIPALDFNLFRSPSIYSVDSGLETISLASSECHSPYTGPIDLASDSESDERCYTDGESSEDDYMAVDERPTSPSTPRAKRTASGDTLRGSPGSPTHTRSTTPTRQGLSHNMPYAHAGAIRSALTDSSFALKGVPSVRNGRSHSASSDEVQPSAAAAMAAVVATNRSASVPVRPQEAIQPHLVGQPSHIADDAASVHGEQGSDWGDDENGFEWLDANTPESTNGDAKRYSSSSNVNGRTSRLRVAINQPTGSGSLSPVPSEGSKESDESPTTPVATAPGSSLLRAPQLTPNNSSQASLNSSSTKKKRPIVIPRRAAPPPPPGAPENLDIPLTRSRSPRSPRGIPTSPGPPVQSRPRASTPEEVPPVVVTSASPSPHRGGDSSSIGIGRPNGRQTNLVSVYELGDASSSSDTLRGGRYAKVPLPAEAPLRGKKMGSPVSMSDMASEHRRREPRRHASSAMLSSRSSKRGSSEEELDLVSQAKRHRDKGDLPKAAWLFMKAAEQGSATGLIHYAIALRHGLGVARDERKAFAELVHACDVGLKESPVDLRAAKTSNVIITPAQRRQLLPDLSLGLTEVANCYLEGSGVKKDKNSGLEYLRLAGTTGDLGAQEQLGEILSRGIGGVKKDVKEAAKWYRAAIQGGSNVPGLAWVWKEKYSC